MQRGLSPSTEEGAAELRASVLTETNRLQWDRVCELVEEYRQQQQQQQAVPDGAAPLIGDSARAAELDAPSSARRAPAMGPVVSSTKRDGAPPPSGATDLKGTVVTLLGSPEGATLRRMLRDVDSTDLILTLSTSARAAHPPRWRRSALRRTHRRSHGVQRVRCRRRPRLVRLGEGCTDAAASDVDEE